VTPAPPLRADCTRCAALCCVVPAFAASADFAVDKPAGRPCPNLGADFGCTVHDRLRPLGFPGCTAYDCFGAGQRVVQETFGGRDWRAEPALAPAMFAAFEVLRDLHEALWYLDGALALAPARPLYPRLRAARARTLRLAGGDPAALAGLDRPGYRRAIGLLLGRTSDLARARLARRGTALAGADLAGRALRGADLRGADLRGALLLGADLRGADLSRADLLGADLRGARLAGADLRTSLFLTRSQVGAAGGDAGTALPPALERPAHWSGSQDIV